ncbi:MAG TPA: hypothetical protein VGG16_09820, partial [Streptosporangiaceae bacterium]
GLTRMDNHLPIRPGTDVHAGDTIRLTGAAKDVDAFAAKAGFKLNHAVRAIDSLKDRTELAGIGYQCPKCTTSAA